MYLARDFSKGKTSYLLRESYQDKGEIKSRDLISLGENPALFIKYPDRGSFYIDEEIEEKLMNLGIKYNNGILQDELEKLLRNLLLQDSDQNQYLVNFLIVANLFRLTYRNP